MEARNPAQDGAAEADRARGECGSRRKLKVNDLEIHAVGMSRSGNHAIADWIFAQALRPKLLLNCAEGKSNPFVSCRPMASGVGWRAEPEMDIAAEREGRFARKALLMHTYEDSWLAHAFSRELEENRDEWLGPSRRRINLLVLRDPYNLFASRLKMDCGLRPHIARGIWKQHAREAVGDTRRLTGETIAVLYNRWKADRSYRRDLAQALGLAFSDAGFQNVPECAGGSSFDGVEFSGRASEMPTERRWRHFVEDERYRNLFDQQMIELTEGLFGLQKPARLPLQSGA